MFYTVHLLLVYCDKTPWPSIGKHLVGLTVLENQRPYGCREGMTAGTGETLHPQTTNWTQGEHAGNGTSLLKPQSCP